MDMRSIEPDLRKLERAAMKRARRGTNPNATRYAKLNVDGGMVRPNPVTTKRSVAEVLEISREAEAAATLLAKAKGPAPEPRHPTLRSSRDQIRRTVPRRV